MRLKVEDLRRYLTSIPFDVNDYEVWIEYPERYGLAKPEIIENIKIDFDDNDIIETSAIGLDNKNKRLIIFHHY